MATDQSAAGQGESQQKPSPEVQIQVTMIAGMLHRWTFSYPGKWEFYTPRPGDLLRVWNDPHKPE
jgi:hypothetical protein